MVNESLSCIFDSNYEIYDGPENTIKADACLKFEEYANEEVAIFLVLATSYPTMHMSIYCSRMKFQSKLLGAGRLSTNRRTT